MDEPTLSGWHLRKTFGEGETLCVALDDVTVDLYPGQVTLLMGPSGSGKSTLLAVMSGLLHPDSGRVEALGQNLWALSDRQREQFRLRHCGFIFQGFNLFPALTARQQLEIVLRWGEGTTAHDARKKSERLLGQLGLGNKTHLRPNQLSGGEKQRVAIGRALVKDPQLLFADEPTSALDWAHGEQVIELLQEAAKERGSTVMIVGHDSRILPFVDQDFHLEDGAMTSPPPVEEHVLRTAR
jgi:putative ABC transport system ATP-binding protein